MPNALRAPSRLRRSLGGVALCLGTIAVAAAADGPTLRAVANMTGTEIIGSAQGAEARMQEWLQKVKVLNESAKKKKDIIQVNCTGDKVTGIKVHLTLTSRAIASMNEAQAVGDQGAVLHEFDLVKLHEQGVKQLSEAAKICVGADASYVGKTTVEIDYSYPDGEDPTATDDRFVATGETVLNSPTL